MLTTLLFFLLFGAAASAILWSAIQLFTVQEDPLEDRLTQLQAYTPVGATAIVTERRRSGGGFWNDLLFFLSRFGMEEYIRDTERTMRSAGVRKKEATAYYIFFQICFFLVLAGGSTYLNLDKDLLTLGMGLIPAGILGFLLPKQILYRLSAAYKEKLQNALPDTVDLLGIVLGTGLSLDQAMLRVSEEMQFIYPELANEFYTVVMQVKAGQERSRAFNQLVRRTGIEDIKSLSAMIIQSEKFGTSLSHALKTYADGLRKRRRRRAQETIAKAGIKMLFPIVIFVLPSLFLITLGPGLISVLRSLSGGIGGPR
jgi:tight adherence protein C